jgi:hypothetical protein
MCAAHTNPRVEQSALALAPTSIGAGFGHDSERRLLRAHVLLQGEPGVGNASSRRGEASAVGRIDLMRPARGRRDEGCQRSSAALDAGYREELLVAF